MKIDKVFYSGQIFDVCSVARNGFIAVYDEPPTKHVDFLNPENVRSAIPCNNCIGNGCPVCCGLGFVQGGIIGYNGVNK